MKFTLSWLKEHLETEADLQTITDTLTAIGLEVEGVEDPSAALSQFVVAEIVTADQHPDADRLKLCRVSVGDEEHQVVCGAPNARAGLKGILARPGDIIPSTGDILKTGKIRGIESHGMMCSARELNLGDDHDGIIELSADALVGSPASAALALEPVIDIALTPNRVDALGVRGVARDLAAAGLGRLKPLQSERVKAEFESSTKVAAGLPADQTHLCPHFVGRTIRGVKNVESPGWLKDRLSAIGLRPVSAVVDITQYVNIDLGRPLHAFDLKALKGNVGPRLAQADETILALNGTEYALDGNMLVIADDVGAQAIAGVMGGESSSCKEDTTDIFLESALFDPISIATTGRSLGIVSDARYRFERGVDPQSTVEGAEIATRMILEICGGEASELVISGQAPTVGKGLTFRPSRVARLGGVEVSETAIQNILERLGFAVEKSAPDEWAVSAPSWRRDVEGEHDLIEEVLRIHGYDHIPSASLPQVFSTKPAFSFDQRRARTVRRALAGRGLTETTTWSFLSKAVAETFSGDLPLVPLQNPISSDLDVMRPSLLPNLVQAAARNMARALPNVAFFEVGPRFEGARPNEQMLVAAGLRAGKSEVKTWQSAARDADVFDVKADALSVLETAGVPTDRLQIGGPANAEAPSWYHPGQSGTLCLGPAVLAEFGALHPMVLKQLDLDGPAVGFEVFLDRIPKPKRQTGPAKAKFAPSAYQPVERDFAFVMDMEARVGDVIRAVRAVDKTLIASVEIFDVYTGDNVEPGEKSVALSVRFEPQKATMTDADIEDVSKKIVTAVERAVDGRLRS